MLSSVAWLTLSCSLFGGGSPLPGSQPMFLADARADSLSALYERGRTWAGFFEAARARKEMWTDNYASGAPAPQLVSRAAAVGGTWRILAVAEDWCGDSANTIPYIARLVEQVPSLELRIVNSTIGRWVMEQHRTPDGRAATPTILLLSADFVEQGCFVERPRELRKWVQEHKPKLSDDEFQRRKMEWYKNDRGRETVREVIELLETATQGSPTCERGK